MGTMVTVVDTGTNHQGPVVTAEALVSQQRYQQRQRQRRNTITGCSSRNRIISGIASVQLLLLLLQLLALQRPTRPYHQNQFHTVPSTTVTNVVTALPVAVVLQRQLQPTTTHNNQQPRTRRMIQTLYHQQRQLQRQQQRDSVIHRGGGGSGSGISTVIRSGTAVSSRQQETSQDDDDHSTGSSSSSGPPNQDTQSKTNNNNWGMTIALCTSYCTVMGAKCALPSVLSLLLSPTIGLTFPPSTSMAPQQMMAQQLTVATASVAMGKLILGPIIDQYGGKRSLQVSLWCLCLCLLMISLCQSFTIFGVAWIMVDFIFSACWPACISTIHDYYRTPTDWSVQIGYLAAAARAGNTMAFLLFASIIHIVTKHFPHVIRQSWRPVFLIAAGIQLIPLTLLSIYGKTTDRSGNDNHENNDKKLDAGVVSSSGKMTTPSPIPNILTVIGTVLRREVPKFDFWLHLINRSMLMIYGSFLLFVPTYMTQIFRTTNTYGAQMGSLYAMGCLLSVTTISKYYPKMTKRTKLWFITMLLLFGATGSSLLQLAHVSGIIHLSKIMSSLLLFTWGFSFAVPFYIPPSLYALSRGGTNSIRTSGDDGRARGRSTKSSSSTATITDIFDIGGFALLAIFNGYVTGINHAQLSAWIPTFGITTGCAILSYLALFITTWREKGEM